MSNNMKKQKNYDYKSIIDAVNPAQCVEVKI